MADLFQTSKQNIAKHLKAIFAEGELAPDSVVNQWLTTAADGKNYRVVYYNLDAILAVGYRVRSPRGVQFRRWASTVLKEYLLKGFGRCADCGACFRIHTQHASSSQGRTPYQYYRCNNNQERINQPRCPSKLVRADAVDEAVWGHLTRLLTQPGLLRAEIERVLNEEQKKQPSAEAAMKEVEAQLTALDESRARGLRAMTKGLVSEEEFAELAARSPAVHRFPGAMAARMQELARIVEETYDGDASRIWTEAKDARDLLKRVMALPGFGKQ